MKGKKLNLTTKILLALVLGIIFGILANAVFPDSFNSTISKWIFVPVGNVFIRLIKMLVVPLVLTSLICGAASITDIKKLGRIGIKITVYYLFTTALAITIALIFANILKPGAGIPIPSGMEFKAAEAPFVMDIFVNMVPTNPIESLVKGEMLQIIFFAIMFGISLAIIGQTAKPLLDVISQINDVLIKIMSLIMHVAPYGVFALISNVIIFQGTDVLVKLFKYGFTVILVLLIQVIIVYGSALKVLGKVSVSKFFKKFWPVMVVAFSTSSSNATIPVNLETCETKLGIPKSTCSFTIPLGATVNMDGTAIMQGVATIFISQLFGIPLTFQQQLMVILMATLASIGTAGVPSVGLVTLSMVLTQVGLPVEGIAIILGIDRILDMSRTVVNITGDAVGTVIVSKSENELDLNVYNS